jgi:hypothetical protein
MKTSSYNALTIPVSITKQRIARTPHRKTKNKNKLDLSNLAPVS